MDRLQDLATQGRLRALLRANQAIIGNLDLPVVLESIVEAAVELVGAKYGALGVISPHGGLEQFINVGMTPELVRQIGHLPEGYGLLGALIDDPRPIRVPMLSEHPRSVGFPAHHPPMTSFLGVPIRVRDKVYGNLYLCDQSSGEFSEDDEQLVVALAATAGTAIQNARLFADTHRRQAWAAASAEITAALLSTDEGNTLGILTSRILTLADADVVWVLQPTADPDRMLVTTAQGIDWERIEGMTLPTNGSIVGSVIEAGQPRQVDDAAGTETLPTDGRPLGPVMAVPLVAPGGGVLLVARLAGRARFARGDLEIAANFAGQASVAMELASARAARQQVALLDDRGRIARDLHDHVIQQLFATGLELQNIAGTAQGDVADRISTAVTNLDGSISQIRTVIFALSRSTGEGHPAIRHAVIDLANEFTHSLARTPTVSFSGPVDLMITEQLADDVLAVTREGLANVVKHAHAKHTSIALAVSGGQAMLTITDDGRGMNNSTRRSGVMNLEHRALARGGSFTLHSDHDGTRLSWTVPIEATP